MKDSYLYLHKRYNSFDHQHYNKHKGINMASRNSTQEHILKYSLYNSFNLTNSSHKDSNKTSINLIFTHKCLYMCKFLMKDSYLYLHKRYNSFDHQHYNKHKGINMASRNSTQEHILKYSLYNSFNLTNSSHKDSNKTSINLIFTHKCLYMCKFLMKDSYLYLHKRYNSFDHQHYNKHKGINMASRNSTQEHILKYSLYNSFNLTNSSHKDSNKTSINLIFTHKCLYMCKLLMKDSYLYLHKRYNSFDHQHYNKHKEINMASRNPK